MREDTALFIITHERVDKQRTLKTLKDGGYCGDVFLVVDDQDRELEKYRKKFGDKVLVFSKQEYWEKTDTFTNEKNLAACVYARNACADFAKKFGYKYFFVCDDDIRHLKYKIPRGKKLVTGYLRKAEHFLGGLIDWMDSTNITAIAVAEDGAFIGGINQEVRDGVKYMLSKLMLYRTQSPLKYKGIVYEDTVTVFDAYRKGKLAFAFMGASTVTPPTNSGKGGCADLYATSNNYVNFFYVVMCRPDACKVTVRKGDWIMTRDKNALVPKIINERWRKNA